MKRFQNKIFILFRDPKLFPNPDEFRPERHLDSSSRFQRSKDIIMFGTGARRCVGETLARDEYFTYFCNLLQKYKFSLKKGTKIDTLPTPGGIFSPKPVEVAVEARK